MTTVGVYLGPLPVILNVHKLDDFLLHLIGNEDKKAIEFGAHQVIVVRNEDSKRRLPEQLCHFLVMTPVEIKGLEFEDVFVYNFFCDAPHSANWNALSTIGSDEKKSRKLKFDAERDQIMCSELKILYMVCTRAKSNLWLFDENRERRKAMEEYWKEKNVVMVAKDSSSLGERGRVMKPSSKQAWVGRIFTHLFFFIMFLQKTDLSARARTCYA